MFPVSNHLQFRTWRSYFRLLAFPVLWILIASIALHVATYPGQIRTEKRVESMKLEFRQWWEYGGKTMLTIQGVNPDDPLEYQKRLQNWINQYTEKKFRYQIHLVPNTAEPHQFFTSWLLQPNWFSLILFVWFFFYAGTWLEDRWGRLRLFAVFVLANALGAALVYGIAGALFQNYLSTPFTGTSTGLAVIMGALVTSHNKSAVPFRIPGKQEPLFFLPALLFVMLWFLADCLVNFYISPGLFTAIIPINFILLPIGMFLGLKLPIRTKSVKEIKKEQLQSSLERSVDVAELQRIDNRTFLADGFAAASRREFQHATEFLLRGLNGLLHETPLDDLTINHAVERMANPELLIDITANQWLEWGNVLSKSGLHQSSILCLERNLALETDEKYARMALLLNGAQRLKFSIEPDIGRQRLKKVIDLKGDDQHAKRAADMLAKYSPKAPETIPQSN